MISDKLMARFKGDEEWTETAYNKNPDPSQDRFWMGRAAEEFAKKQYELFYHGQVELDNWYPIVEVTNQSGTTRIFKLHGYYEPEFDAEPL